jgi:hypothetical protein
VDVFGSPSCDQLVFFGNSVCLRCGTLLPFDPEGLAVVVDDPETHCANRDLAGCNWLAGGGQRLCRRWADPHPARPTTTCRCWRTRRRRDREAAPRRPAAGPRPARQACDEERGTGVAFDLLASTEGP